MTPTDKAKYQTNRRRMAWSALAMMGIVTIATILDPQRMAQADGVLMTQYIALSGVVGAYFGFASKTQDLTKKDKL